MKPPTPKIGFIGLGHIGRHFAANLAKSGFDLTVYDKAGTKARAPRGATCGHSAADVFEACDIIGLSLPHGDAVLDVVKDVVTAQCRPDLLFDLSTIGVEAAKKADQLAGAAGVGYLDCPVSGGVAAARQGAVSIMAAGDRNIFDQCGPLFEVIAQRVFYIGEQAGLGQALKLANNFLSATALAAASEAVCFGEQAGIDMKTMLDALNASSGRSAATEDKFINEVLTEQYASGFVSQLMAKDLRLYRAATQALGVSGPTGDNTEKIWTGFSEQSPNRDFTEIYLYIRKRMLGK